MDHVEFGSRMNGNDYSMARSAVKKNETKIKHQVVMWSLIDINIVCSKFVPAVQL